MRLFILCCPWLLVMWSETWFLTRCLSWYTVAANNCRHTCILAVFEEIEMYSLCHFLLCTTLYQILFVLSPLRRFDQLSELMSEEDNCRVYQTEIEKLLKSDTSFIPFLGSFLTQVYLQLNLKILHGTCMIPSPSPHQCRHSYVKIQFTKNLVTIVLILWTLSLILSLSPGCSPSLVRWDQSQAWKEQG